MADKIVIASVRLPIVVRKEAGSLVFRSSPGGLVSGVSSIEKSADSIWVGWPGIASDELTAQDRKEITTYLHERGCHPIFLTQEQINGFYYGYCNATLWPMFHYFYKSTEFQLSYWESYKEVNRLFSKEILQFATKNSYTWIHDYQLMLVPKLLRQKLGDAAIGFFLHTPFPSFEIFRLLPEREALLEGLLGANLVGFHTYDYVRHFLSSVLRLLGHESSLGAIKYDARIVQTDAFPIGIDYKKYAAGARTRSAKRAFSKLNVLKARPNVVLSVDRADYSKGIPARLDAFELFLRDNPEYLGNVTFILIAEPTRTEIAAYKELRETIEQKVSRINGEFATTDWVPIIYRYQSVDFNELTSLYALADVMMVTPIRDGMNLVAKEYIASRHNSTGVLLLSEMAGVATEVPEALLVNPNSAHQVAAAIKGALTMSVEEQRKRMRIMQARISEYTIDKWAHDFLSELKSAAQKEKIQPKLLSDKERKTMVQDYCSAERRLILLDYDGTLKSFVKSPDPLLARPTAKVKRTLKKLAADPRNRVVIVSGRPKTTLEMFFSDVGLGLIAEHGGWVFEAGQWVKSSVASRRWKKAIIPTLQKFVSRTPGSVFEEKDFSLVWHYRQTSPDLAYVRKKELVTQLRNLLPDEIGVFEGQKILEIKPKNMHKGALVTEILTSEKWDFIMVVGDDYTDEDMFVVVPERAYSIHVGMSQTAARFQLKGVPDVISLVTELSECS